MKKNEAIKKFDIDIGGLSQNEQAVLKKLIRAAELIAPIYLVQKNSDFEGANFYPQDADREEIETAAQKDPAILSPYTFVERDESGNLKAVPFCVKFENELKSVAKLLREAAEISEDKELAQYLNCRAEDMLSDNYDESNIFWLKTEKSKIGCVIGPFDRYLDKLFFKKRAYMAWVGVLDEEMTNQAEKIKSILLLGERKFLPGAKKAKIPKIRARIEDTAIFSGLVADFMFAGNNLPSSDDIELIGKYGTLFTVFNPSVNERFEKWIMPVFNGVFNKAIQKKYSKKELHKAFLNSIILHEACHSLMRYEDAASRLKEFFPFFDELYTDILATKGYGSLLLKDAISQRELEAFLIIYICRHLHWLTVAPEKPQILHYATGGAISLKFFLENGALKKRLGGRLGGMFLVDFNKIFICVDQLSRVLEYHLSLGNRDEAGEFVQNHGSFDIFQKFEPCLRKLREKPDTV